jgi:hypothetical protein
MRAHPRPRRTRSRAGGNGAQSRRVRGFAHAGAGRVIGIDADDAETGGAGVRRGAAVRR